MDSAPIEAIRSELDAGAPFRPGAHSRDPLGIVEPSLLAGKAVPPRRWIVEGWIPAGSVTMLGGDGGAGKTLLAMQLLTSCATGRPWLGLGAAECRTLGVFCEDDLDELHRRQAAINEALGVDFADLTNMRWLPRVGHENALAYFDERGACEPTKLLGSIMNQAVGFGARLVVLDSLHDLFVGNENHRSQARGFIGLLRQIALEIDGAVVITAHPSMAGRRDGTGESGSTAWNAAVRSRLYLARTDDDDRDCRVLSRKKSNYAAAGDQLRVRWRDGVFVAEEAEGGMMASLNRKRAEAAFLACLDATTREGRDVSASPQASNFAPRMFARRKERDGRKLAELVDAMESLFAQGRIRVEEFGRAGDRRRRIIRVEGSQGGMDP